MKIGFVALFVLFAGGVIADIDITTAGEVVVNSSLVSKLHINRSPNAVIDYVAADLSYFPQASKNQIVERGIIAPRPVENNERNIERNNDSGVLRFFWKSPDMNVLSISVDSQVRSRAFWPNVFEKIPFPIKEVPQDVVQYTLPSKMIDSENLEIVATAGLLAQGEDDLFALVTKIAGWTKNNVEYNLSTLTAEVVQPASWVLREKYGACDEMTGLFIAFLRALGIPARYVSGISYTNSPLFSEKWGSHGWAEVFFPGVGWLPFDPTFGQFGWVDASHVKFRSSVDSSEPSLEYTWRARDSSISSEKMVVKTSLLNHSSSVEKRLSVSVKALNSEVGFGSFAVVEAVVENLKGYYAAADLSLSPVNELIIDKSTRTLFLAPHESKRVYWIVQVRPDLDKNYRYELPVHVSSERNESGRASIAAKHGSPVFKRQDFDELINVNAQQAIGGINLICSADDSYVNTAGRIWCVVQNKKNKVRKFVVCMQEDCKQLIAEAGGQQIVEWPVFGEMPGIFHRQIELREDGKLSNEKNSLFAWVPWRVLDSPKASIESLSFPSKVNSSEWFVVRVFVKKESFAVPKNLSVSVSGFEGVVVDELAGDRTVDLRIRGSVLGAGTTKFVVILSIDGRVIDKKQTEITVTPDNWIELLKGYAVRIIRYFFL